MLEEEPVYAIAFGVFVVLSDNGIHVPQPESHTVWGTHTAHPPSVQLMQWTPVALAVE